MNKTLTLTLGGQEHPLLFGVNGFFFHIKDATGQDPFEWLKKFDEHRQKISEGQSFAMVYLEDVNAMIYAGINSYLDVNDQENIPLSKITKWANGLSFDDITAVFITAMTAFSKGEEKPQVNGATVVVEPAGD